MGKTYPGVFDRIQANLRIFRACPVFFLECQPTSTWVFDRTPVRQQNAFGKMSRAMEHFKKFRKQFSIWKNIFGKSNAYVFSPFIPFGFLLNVELSLWFMREKIRWKQRTRDRGTSGALKALGISSIKSGSLSGVGSGPRRDHGYHGCHFVTVKSVATGPTIIEIIIVMTGINRVDQIARVAFELLTDVPIAIDWLSLALRLSPLPLLSRVSLLSLVSLWSREHLGHITIYAFTYFIIVSHNCPIHAQDNPTTTSKQSHDRSPTNGKRFFLHCLQPTIFKKIQNHSVCKNGLD